MTARFGEHPDPPCVCCHWRPATDGISCDSCRPPFDTDEPTWMTNPTGKRSKRGNR